LNEEDAFGARSRTRNWVITFPSIFASLPRLVDLSSVITAAEQKVLAFRADTILRKGGTIKSFTFPFDFHSTNPLSFVYLTLDHRWPLLQKTLPPEAFISCLASPFRPVEWPATPRSDRESYFIEALVACASDMIALFSSSSWLSLCSPIDHLGVPTWKPQGELDNERH